MYVSADPPVTRRYLVVICTDQEQALIHQQAKAAGVSLSDYVRRALSNMWLEESDSVPVLRERRQPHGEA